MAGPPAKIHVLSDQDGPKAHAPNVPRAIMQPKEPPAALVVRARSPLQELAPAPIVLRPHGQPTLAGPPAKIHALLDQDGPKAHALAVVLINLQRLAVFVQIAMWQNVDVQIIVHLARVQLIMRVLADAHRNFFCIGNFYKPIRTHYNYHQQF